MGRIRKTGLKVLKTDAYNYSQQDLSRIIPIDFLVKIRYISRLNDRQIVIATVDEFFYFNEVTELLDAVKSLKTEAVKLSSIQRADNLLYLISTDDRLFTFNLSTHRLSRINAEISNVGCFVKYGDHWLIAQTKGNLYQWNPQSVQSFDHLDGLPHGGLNGKSCLMIDGVPHFSAFDGVYAFNNHALSRNIQKPMTKLHEVRLNNKNRVQLNPQNLALTIEEKDFPVSFQLSASSYVKQQRNQYQYRLNNHHQAWREVSAATGKVVFDGLAPAEYTIEFRSSNNDDLWSEPIQFQLSVLPPVWLSARAKVGNLMILMVLGYAFYDYRVRLIRHRARSLEIEIRKRTRALKIEKAKVEKLLSYKNQELATLSHEFKTPLTLILGPLEQIIQLADSMQIAERLKTMRRNAYR